MTSKLKNLLRMAAGLLRERSWRRSVRSLRSALYDRRRARSAPFDDAFGTDTERKVTLADLDATGGDVPALWRYRPTPRDSFADIMRAIDVPFERTEFVDLGSGKGRALIMASEFPFRRVVGVELSPALHRVAERNIQRWRVARRTRVAIELRCMDAAEWNPPSGETLIYLFQPFPVETLRRVLARLVAALSAAPRPAIHLAYLDPLHHELIAESGAFTVGRWGQATHKGAFDWAIYHSAP